MLYGPVVEATALIFLLLFPSFAELFVFAFRVVDTITALIFRVFVSIFIYIVLVIVLLRVDTTAAPPVLPAIVSLFCCTIHER